MRRLLNQAAHAAVKTNGSIFQITFRRLRTRMSYQAAIWAIAHRICRLIWLILHKGVHYQERGGEVSAKSRQTRTAACLRNSESWVIASSKETEPQHDWEVFSTLSCWTANWPSEGSQGRSEAECHSPLTPELKSPEQAGHGDLVSAEDAEKESPR